MNVLLVEDHEDSRDAAIIVLRGQGMAVETAVSAEQALVKATTARPDVIVIELCLQGMSSTS
jgi:CheY-like chemotaxis protein